MKNIVIFCVVRFVSRIVVVVFMTQVEHRLFRRLPGTPSGQCSEGSESTRPALLGKGRSGIGPTVAWPSGRVDGERRGGRRRRRCRVGHELE